MNVDFWSSVEYTAHTRELGAVLAGHGITLRSRFQVPQSEYWVIHSGFLSRIWLRLRMYAIYPLQLACDFLFRREPRVAIVCTTCFYAPWLASLCGGRHRRVVNLLYDLYPESLIEAGVLRAESTGARLLRRMAAAAARRRAAANVLLGERLAAQARASLPTADHARSTIIPVGAVERPFANHEPQRRPAGQPPVILYCGNMGHVHDVDTVAQFLAEGGHSGVSWRFHATGAGYARFKARVAQKPPDLRPPTSDLEPRTLISGHRILLGASLQDAEWEVAMREADVALVTMSPGAERVLMPSKTYSALLAGQAILAVCPEASDLADLVRRHDCGWVVAPGDTAGLQRAVAEIVARPDEVLRLRRNARAAGTREYGLAAVGRQWAELLQRVGQ